MNNQVQGILGSQDCLADSLAFHAGALWELHDLVSTAKGNRANCLQLDSYGQDILRVFDAEGFPFYPKAVLLLIG